MLELSNSIAVFLLGQCVQYNPEWLQGPVCGVFGPTNALGTGINHLGTVCGYSEDCNFVDFPFVWALKGGLSPISFPVVTGTARAADVNAAESVTGTVTGTMFRGFVADASGVVFLPPLDGEQLSWAEALNDSGIAVGFSTGAEQRAVYWQDGSAVLLALPDGPSSFAEDINNRNQICGWMGVDPNPQFGAAPFIWQNGVTRTLPLPAYALANSGAATGINNLGDACGIFYVADAKTQQPHRRACAWIEGEFIDLGVLPGGEVSHAFDINDAREIVGYCIVDSFFHGFVWRDGVMLDLADLVPTGNVIPQDARAINNLGQIAGGAALLPDNDGVAFRLTPALPAIPGNTNCDQAVDVDDLINVILHWNPQGPVGGRPADVNRDNRIDFEDLIEVIQGWSFSG